MVWPTQPDGLANPIVLSGSFYAVENIILRRRKHLYTPLFFYSTAGRQFGKRQYAVPQNLPTCIFGLAGHVPIGERTRPCRCKDTSLLVKGHVLVVVRTRPCRCKDTSLLVKGHVLVGERTRPYWCIQADSGGTKQAGGKSAARLKCFLGEMPMYPIGSAPTTGVAMPYRS